MKGGVELQLTLDEAELHLQQREVFQLVYNKIIIISPVSLATD